MVARFKTRAVPPRITPERPKPTPDRFPAPCKVCGGYPAPFIMPDDTRRCHDDWLADPDTQAQRMERMREDAGDIEG